VAGQGMHASTQCRELRQSVALPRTWMAQASPSSGPLPRRQPATCSKRLPAKGNRKKLHPPTCHLPFATLRLSLTRGLAGRFAGDSGNGTLRWAITESNRRPGTDRIVFSLQSNETMITLQTVGIRVTRALLAVVPLCYTDST